MPNSSIKNRLFKALSAATAIFGFWLPLFLPQYLAEMNGMATTEYVSLNKEGLVQTDTADLKPNMGGEIPPSDQAVAGRIAMVGNDTILKTSQPTILAANKKKIIVTAYSSTVDQTDSTPFITASGTRVRDGVIASNFLPFGQRVKFPKLFGEKIFVVEDRLAPKNGHKVDIWMPSRKTALNFGVQYTEMEIM